MTLLFGARAVFALLLALITFLTVTPNPEDTQSGMAVMRWISSLFFGDGAYGDKIAHFLAYAALGLSAAAARIEIAGRPLATIAALAAYGVLLEGVQGIMGVRQPELYDALANAAGAISGMLAGGAVVARLGGWFGARP